ncbi:tRNA dihydrouridine(16) synthase DusC [Salinivibrio sp. IB872]|uniref:tRNA dihydrouridine(16) synthase DusC n=1 Tax=Salinivibrio sp. IB872 TaxID=1766123 RepID=UPI000984383F|nr:tRNA dihydrouridine(16) synthase DusC [Salinivibrio sp. IB872]OOF28242.1 tRNA dihydrouridine(16) synthase DusC [Salinivibrio sp. IB872]
MSQTYPSAPRVVLGPMEGVLDPLMRNLLTEINHYSLCVTEFVRVVDQRLPEKVFYRLCPELHQGGVTAAGTPVRVQLLGQDPVAMARNAIRAIELGSHGIDINFGCPSKTVNGNRGGAALLKTPEHMFDVVKAVRDAVDSAHVVSAKIRLGYNDLDDYPEIADAVYQAGASELVVHGRTKRDGYKAGTIRWDLIAEINQQLPIPVTANGDIWHREDALRCQAITGCDTLMVCRGALNMPNLGAHIRDNVAPMAWTDVLTLLVRYTELELQGDKGQYFPNRIKQWFKYLRQYYPQADACFKAIRVLNRADEIVRELDNARLADATQQIRETECQH